MNAIVITRPGEAGVLEMREVPDPAPLPGQVRVRVQATALNRADLLQRRGFYPAPPGVPPDIPGLEFSGIVEEDLSSPPRWKPGRRVMGLLAGGGYAEYVTLPAEHLLPVPEGMSWTEAAAIPEAFLTAFDALILQAGLQPGERALIHAVGSGVGTAALQLARRLPAQVFGTSRQASKLERLAELGLDCGIDTRHQDFAAVVETSTGGAGVDVILDLVGGDQLNANLGSLSLRGRMVVVGLVGGRTASLDLGLLLRKRATLRGTVLRSRTDSEKAGLIAEFAERALPGFSDGSLHPQVDRVFPLHEAAAAHRYMESDRNLGKIVLLVS